MHNPETDQGYVGSSKDIEERRDTHFKLLQSGKHPNRRLQAAYDANPNFDFVGLVLGDREAAFDYEQSVLDELGYGPELLNISRNARYCRVDGLKHTDETKEKIRAAAMGHTHNQGRKHTVETRAKVSAALTGRPVSQETRDKIRESNSEYARSVSIDGTVYPSIAEAARVLGLKKPTLRYRVESESFPSYFFV